MVDICEGATASGEDAFHPGESILTAGESFQELEGAANVKSDEDKEEIPLDDTDEGENKDDDMLGVSDDEVCVTLPHSLNRDTV